MPNEYTVRAATGEDAEPIARLSRDLGYPTDAEAIRGRLARILGRPDQRVIVAVGAGGEVCGWLQAHSSDVLESGPRVEIVGMIVAESVRRKGVGRALVAQAEAWASEISAEAIVVRSNAKRVESHAFYPALGYMMSKTQVVYRKKAPI